MQKPKTYTVPASGLSGFEHPHPERTARIGQSYGHGLSVGMVTFREYGTRSAMLDAYYAHADKCGATPHACLIPLVKN